MTFSKEKETKKLYEIQEKVRKQNNQWIGKRTKIEKLAAKQ